MCQSAFDTDNKCFVWNVGELAEVVGGMDYIDCDDDVELRAEECLCGVHVADTLVEAGFIVWINPQGDSMQFSFRRPPTGS